jgi:hypothetical protein
LAMEMVSPFSFVASFSTHLIRSFLGLHSAK